MKLNEDITIAGEVLQSLGLCSALRAFEQGGIFIVPQLKGRPHSIASYDQRRNVEDLAILTQILKGPHSVASYNTLGDVEDLFNPDPHGKCYTNTQHV
jgi:hypothetical protein